MLLPRCCVLCAKEPVPSGWKPAEQTMKTQILGGPFSILKKEWEFRAGSGEETLHSALVDSRVNIGPAPGASSVGP